MDQKINRAVLCLYAIAGIQILSLIYAIYLNLQLLQYTDALTGMGVTSFSMLAPALFWAACMVAAIYKTAPELRKQTPWAWAVAVAIFVMAVPGWALPASVVGLVSLLDLEVRGYFLERLNIKL